MGGTRLTNDQLNKLIELKAVTESRDWKEGNISSGEPRCIVTCDCGREVNIPNDDFAMFCKCGKAYVTRFYCYRIPNETIMAVMRGPHNDWRQLP